MTAETAPPPTRLKAKTDELGMALYLKLPPGAQTAVLNAVIKANPMIAAVKPHARKIGGGVVGLVALRSVLGRRKR